MKRPLLLLLLCLFCTSLVVGCVKNDRGVSPDPGKLHYPLGLAVHPSGKYLYVLNTNFDLAYNGGSVMVLDTTEKDKKVFNLNNVQTELYTLKTLSKATVEVGSFGAQMKLNASGTRMYLAVRQDQRKGSRKPCSSNADCASDEICQVSVCEYRQLVDSASITVLKVDVDKTDNQHLQCNQITITKEQTGGVGSENTFDQEPAPICGDKSKLFLEGVKCETDADCKTGENCDTNAGVCTGSLFPFGLALNQVCKTGCKQDSDCGQGQTCSGGFCSVPQGTTLPRCDKNTPCPSTKQTCTDERLYISHIDYRGLSALDVQKTDDKNPVGAWTFRALSDLPINMTAISLIPPQSPLAGGGQVFLASRSDRNMFILPPLSQTTANDDIVSFRYDHASFESTTSVNSDMRGMTLGHDKHNKWVRMYVASRSPGAILVYNVTRSPDTQQPVLTLVGTVPVGANPSQVVYRPRPGGLSDLLYVVCSKERRVDVIDTQSLKVIHQIKVGEQPYFITLYDPDFNDPNVKVRHRRAYVSNFLDTSISIIDLDSHRVIGRVTGIDTSLKVSP